MGVCLMVQWGEMADLFTLSPKYVGMQVMQTKNLVHGNAWLDYLIVHCFHTKGCIRPSR